MPKKRLLFRFTPIWRIEKSMSGNWDNRTIKEYLICGIGNFTQKILLKKVTRSLIPDKDNTNNNICEIVDMLREANPEKASQIKQIGGLSWIGCGYDLIDIPSPVRHFVASHGILDDEGEPMFIKLDEKLLETEMITEVIFGWVKYQLIYFLSGRVLMCQDVADGRMYRTSYPIKFFVKIPSCQW